MNYWAIDKDFRIKHLLILLSQSLGEKSFSIANNPDENMESVRIINPNDDTLSAYVYTYGQEEECYGVHLEYPDLQETSLNNTLDIYDNVNFASLCELIQTHLNIFKQK
ncbi:MAG: hypothetical protein R3240_07165 [Gammaproteobacteria bacterium]|nr:hypothetical protein [Gammaproteobacteria bacterium]